MVFVDIDLQMEQVEEEGRIKLPLQCQDHELILRKVHVWIQKPWLFPVVLFFFNYPTSSSTTSFANHVHFGTFPSHETYVHRSNNK